MSRWPHRILCLVALALTLGGCAAASGDGPASAGDGPATGSSAGGARAYRVEPQPPPGSCHARGAPPFTLPDRSCTPGARDPRVSQASIRATICRRGYTRTVRPPYSVTRREKRASLAAYGDSGSPHRYEYDHLIPLELGGAPNDPRNLWPEPGGSPNDKDYLEEALNHQVCRGEVTLRSAQREIATDWVAAYQRLVG